MVTMLIMMMSKAVNIKNCDGTHGLDDYDGEDKKFRFNFHQNEDHFEK